jgi:hypothetical protein
VAEILRVKAARRPRLVSTVASSKGGFKAYVIHKMPLPALSLFAERERIAPGWFSITCDVKVTGLGSIRLVRRCAGVVEDANLNPRTQSFSTERNRLTRPSAERGQNTGPSMI